MNLFQDLEARGLVAQASDHEVPIARALEQRQVVYAGFDPTAPSLHVGNLVPLLGLRRFQQAGHEVLALAGGATGLVGDPSGKSEERNLLGRDALAHNLSKIKAQMERFLEFGAGKGRLVDNIDWTGDLKLLDFLRDVGKHFKVNVMIKKDSVKDRLEREGEGLSFTEFAYMLLQANDYLVLAREHGCTLQIGGSDQWGNITAGIELIRRVLSRHVYGLTFPLLKNSDGSKFGKTAKGAVFLDPEMTSPFEFRQFWFTTADADVGARLRTFTFLPLEQIADLERKTKEKSGEPNEAQRVLARTMTEMVHGKEEADRVERAIEMLFGNPTREDLLKIPASSLEGALAGAPVATLRSSARASRARGCRSSTSSCTRSTRAGRSAGRRGRTSRGRSRRRTSKGRRRPRPRSTRSRSTARRSRPPIAARPCATSCTIVTSCCGRGSETTSSSASSEAAPDHSPNPRPVAVSSRLDLRDDASRFSTATKRRAEVTGILRGRDARVTRAADSPAP
jgi:tyrosyl-tRNA synthetase